VSSVRSGGFQKGRPEGIHAGRIGFNTEDLFGLKGVGKGKRTGVEPDSAAPFTPVRAVFQIAFDGETCSGKLGPDLMAPPGTEIDFQKKITFSFPQKTVPEAGLLERPGAFSFPGTDDSFVSPGVNPNPVDQFPPGQVFHIQEGFSGGRGIGFFTYCPIPFFRADYFPVYPFPRKDSAQKSGGVGSFSQKETA
jgi:hypothetical protein